MTQQLTLAEQADQIEAEAKAISQMSMFNQPAAIKQMLPTLTGLIKQLCATVDAQQQLIKKQTEQIKVIQGGY